MTYSATTLAASILLWSGATLAAPAGTDPATGQQDPAMGGQPGAAAGEQPQAESDWSAAGTQDRQAAAGGSGLEFVSAEKLVGRAVSTTNGEDVGSVKYVAIDVADRGASHLIVDTSGTDLSNTGQAATGSGQASERTAGAASADSGERQTAAATDPTESRGQTVIGSEPAPTADAPGQTRQTASAGTLIVLPWTVVQMDGEQIETVASGRQISQAPRLQEEDLHQLTEPALVAYVVDYWAPASELAAFESQRRREQQDETARPDASQPDGEAASSAGSQPDAGQQQAGAEGRSADTAGAQAGAGQQAADPSGQRGSDQGDQRALVLMGQGVATQVMPPMFQMSEQLKGAEVQGRDGERLGEIRRIIIDQSNGQGAYAVVEQRAAGEPAAVPLPALQWGSDGTATVDASSSDLEANATLTQNPEEVQRADLAQLYQSYGVQPYWNERGAAGAGSAAPQQP